MVGLAVMMLVGQIDFAVVELLLVAQLVEVVHSLLLSEGSIQAVGLAVMMMVDQIDFADVELLLVAQWVEVVHLLLLSEGCVVCSAIVHCCIFLFCYTLASGGIWLHSLQ